jgi:hypothetical protein
MFSSEKELRRMPISHQRKAPNGTAATTTMPPSKKVSSSGGATMVGPSPSVTPQVNNNKGKELNIVIILHVILIYL